MLNGERAAQVSTLTGLRILLSSVMSPRFGAELEGIPTISGGDASAVSRSAAAMQWMALSPLPQ